MSSFTNVPDSLILVFKSTIFSYNAVTSFFAHSYSPVLRKLRFQLVILLHQLVLLSAGLPVNWAPCTPKLLCFLWDIFGVNCYIQDIPLHCNWKLCLSLINTLIGWDLICCFLTTKTVIMGHWNHRTKAYMPLVLLTPKPISSPASILGPMHTPPTSLSGPKQCLLSRHLSHLLSPTRHKPKICRFHLRVS